MSNIKDIFVSYQIAKQVKEKGFNNPCFAYYKQDKHSSILETIDISEWHSKYKDLFICPAPTHQQVMDWAFLTHNKILNYNIDKTIMEKEIQLWLESIK